MNNKPINVTTPFLAPLDEYVEFLKGVWQRGILTHNGPLVQQLEKEVCQNLSLDNFIAVSNGTIALQMAIKALELRGEIITTSFTWIATVSAIKWENCTPIFCDIDPETLNIDPSRIESLITKNTVAIMPVHVFGNPCDIEKIETIAKNCKLKVIYDGAHAFGSIYKGRSLLSYGDITATSLHATKLMNSAEGGGCIASNEDVEEKLKRIRFFGHDDNKDIVEDGFNGKMTEVHAALGLANIKYLNTILEDRKMKYEYYRKNFSSVPYLRIQKLYGETNYSYFPVIFDTEDRLIIAEKKLNSENIFPRRYFYPSVNTYKSILPYTPNPVSEDVSRRILCLPLSYGITYDNIDRILQTIIS